MKKFLILVIAQLTGLIAFSQISLSNTKWSVHLETPRRADFIWLFKNDSFFVHVDNEKQPLGVGTYKQHNDSLLIHKVSGTSPCPDGSEGWYRIEWLENGKKIKLHLLKDDCPARYLLYPNLDITRIREDNKEGK